MHEIGNLGVCGESSDVSERFVSGCSSPEQENR